MFDFSAPLPATAMLKCNAPLREMCRGCKCDALQHTTRQWQAASQAWCLAGEVSFRLRCCVAHCVLVISSAMHFPPKHGLHMHMLASHELRLLWCCNAYAARAKRDYFARSGGPAAALQSAAGFAAFSYVMDRLQPVPEAEAAQPPGHAAQVQFSSGGCQD